MTDRDLEAATHRREAHVTAGIATVERAAILRWLRNQAAHACPIRAAYIHELIGSIERCCHHRETT